MDFEYTDFEFQTFLEDDRLDFEKDVEAATYDLVGPDRWCDGEIYTALIDKKYKMELYTHDPNEIEIIVKVNGMKNYYTVSVYGWVKIEWESNT